MSDSTAANEIRSRAPLNPDACDDRGTPQSPKIRSLISTRGAREAREGGAAGRGRHPPTGGPIGPRGLRSGSLIARLDRIAEEVVHDLRYTRIENGCDRRGRVRYKYRRVAVDAQQAHAIISALKFRLELFSSYAVGERLAQQLAQLAELEAEIARLKNRLGTEA